MGSPKLNRRMILEALETRQLSAADLHASLDGTVLRVEGSAAKDWIIARLDNGGIKVDGTKIQSGDALVDSVSLEQVRRIELFGLGGDDYMAVLGTDCVQFPDGISIQGGTGRDAVLYPIGAQLSGSDVDFVLSTTEYNRSPEIQSRFDLLSKFVDRSGYIGEYKSTKAETESDGEATLYTAIAVTTIATGNYHQDGWEESHANEALEQLLNTLLHKSWGNADSLGQTHPIRNSEKWDYDEQGNAIRQSPMTKDSFGAIIAAAHYAYQNPHSSNTVRQLARDLVDKWSDYLTSHQWRTHSNYIAGEFETVKRGDRDPNATDSKKKEDVYKYIFSPLYTEEGKEQTLADRSVMSKGIEAFTLLPHEVYALQNVAADMGLSTSQWIPWASLSESMKQSVSDYAAPHLRSLAEKGMESILKNLIFITPISFTMNIGGRSVSVDRGDFKINIPEDVRNSITKKFGAAVELSVKELSRLSESQSMGSFVLGNVLDGLLDQLPGQLGKDSWRSILTGAVQQVLPWVNGQGLIEAGTFIATLQTLKDEKVFNKLDSKPDVVSYTFWSYLSEMETRPEMADLLKPVVQEFFSFLRADGNPNTLWAWLAEDSGRVNEHLRLFENRTLAADPSLRLSAGFAYSSAKFNEFAARSEVDSDGVKTTIAFPRLDYLVVHNLVEKGNPKGVSDVAARWWQEFRNAAQAVLNRLIEQIKADIGKAGEYVRERIDAAGNYIKERWTTAGEYLVNRRDAAGKYTTEKWNSANRTLLEQGDALGKTYVEVRDAAGKLLQNAYREADRWISRTYNGTQLLNERIHFDRAGTKLYQFRAWSSGKLTDFEQYTSSGAQEINKYISSTGKWVSQRLDSAGRLINEWIYHDDAGKVLYQVRAWAGGKLTDFEQYTSSGVQEINKYISTSGKWVSQRLDAAGRVVTEWIYHDDVGQTLYQYRTWAGSKLTNFEQFTSKGVKEIDKFVNSSGKWVSQRLDAAGTVIEEWMYHDDVGQKLYQFRSWSAGKLTQLEQLTTSGVRSFFAYVSTTGNWVERSYSNGIETSVKVWNSAGKYLGDQTKNFKDAAAKLDPTTKSWWKL